MRTNGTKDLTRVGANNPTKALEREYRSLMAIGDADALAEQATEIVRSAGGVSDANFRKFQHDLKQALGKGLAKVREFLSNYVLAGCGLAVGRYQGRQLAGVR